MSEVMAGAEHGAHPTAAHAEHHPNALRYVQIAVVLTTLTLCEVGVYYLRPIHVVLAPTLLALSAVKFVLVVLFYMHLKFDNRLFSALFTLGLTLAGMLMITLLFLTRSYFLTALTTGH